MTDISLVFWMVFAVVVIAFIIATLRSTIYCSTNIIDNLVSRFFHQRVQVKTVTRSPRSKLDCIFPITLSWSTCYLMATGFFVWLLLLTYIFYLFIVSPVSNGVPRDSFGDFLQHQLTITDTAHYYELAQWGYNNPHDGLDSLAFFPLYPWVLFMLHQLIPIRYELIGLAVNFVLLGVIIKYLYQFAYQKLSPLGAGITVALLLVFPVSFFLLIPGTTTLFIFLSLLVFTALEQKKYPQACLLAFFTALTRVQGFLLFLPLFMFTLGNTHRGKNQQLTMVGNMTLACLPLLGLGVYLLINYLVADDPLAFLVSQTNSWGNSFQNPITTVYRVLHTAFSSSPDKIVGRWGAVLLCFLISCFTLSYGVKKKFPGHLIAYLLTYLLLSFSVSNPMSGQRFVLMLWPLFIIQAHFLLHHQKLIPACFLFCLTMLPLMWYFYCFYNGYVVC